MIEALIIIGIVVTVALQWIIHRVHIKSLGLFHELLKSAQDDNRRMIDALMMARDKPPIFGTIKVEQMPAESWFDVKKDITDLEKQ